ncbi:TonB-dependent receptor plug domain-containing protein [Rurimicrobium arvi]|uniref:TonB-dependent receptor n=1 Tax=Rurimicrobium arvi TaxID=2049916 RepID=A0ABP8MKW5_9BACT
MKKMMVLLAFQVWFTVQAQETDTAGRLSEVVIRGANRAVGRGEQVIPTEIISTEFFRKNPTANLLEAVALLNGVRPQLNCSVCNTGDIHINGMEGPYTMVLIDGMPIVSSLSTVYGFSGIPNSIIERVEIIKGPAGAQYSPEAMGGLINIITKKVSAAPRLSIDMYGTSWLESNTDIATRFRIGKKIQSLLSANYYRFQTPTDHNRDGFTDMPLQNRVSLFNKWSFARKQNKVAEIALRCLQEDRWGGQTFWKPYMRGTETAYAEQITTKRWESIAQYEWPLKEKIKSQLSYNWHDQNSMYGTTAFVARQQVFFGQTIWEKQVSVHHLLLGSSIRYTWYDDNTPATRSADSSRNQPSKRSLSGAFLQDEWSVCSGVTLSLGYRADYDPVHKWIHTPRVALKYSNGYAHTFRLAAGNGYRVVNVFTEDHAALSGARDVVIAEQLRPERSWSSTCDYLFRFAGNYGTGSIDVSPFYSYFYNKIVGDFDTDPQKIIYKNLSGNALSRGVTLNADYTPVGAPLSVTAGITYMDVLIREEENGILLTRRQLFAPTWSGNLMLTYRFKKKIIADLTAKWEGSMRLPVVPNDFRPEYSPWMCTANFQLSYKASDRFTVYGGVKNLLNTVPKNPILRPFDPFDKTASDPVTNPNGYTFDPSYSYASMQGIRGFFGLRYTL